MKKKVAVFANGWGCEYMHQISDGLMRRAKKENADIFTFVDFSVHGQSDGFNDGEMNIFHLPEIGEFDGVVLLANSYNDAHELEYLCHEVKRTGIPAISLGYELAGMVNICTDNYSGMYELAEHLLLVHNVREVLIIGGIKGHQESNERIRAVLDAYQENGCPVPEENVAYGNWAADSAVDCFIEWTRRTGHHPQAVICANDVMALGLCDYFDENDISVPEDIIVTGYDRLAEGQRAKPTMVSVSQEWEQMGEAAFDCLMRLWNGEKCDDLWLNSKFYSGGSCGCRQVEEEAPSPHQRKKAQQNTRMGFYSADSHFRHIYLATRRADNEDILEGSMNALFRDDHWMEGENFMVCLEKEFFRIEENDTNLRTIGYSNELNAICCLQEGVPQPRRVMQPMEAVFYFSRLSEKATQYIFVPIYTESRTMGFAIMNRDMGIAEDKFLYIWTRHMNQYMEQVRRNITIADLTRKLRLSSITDSLTGVYNRSGCEGQSYPMLEKYHANGERGVVMIIDIDRMKTINDFYGHIYGDLSLCLVATVLKEEAPKGWIPSRFGGDEFMLAGGLGTNDVEEVMNRLYDRVAREVKQRSLSFPLSLSIGYSIIEPDVPFNIRETIQKADAAMYEIKKQHHEMLDGKKA